MKLAEVKNIFSISKLWKKSSAEVRPEDPQDRQPRSATSDDRSQKKSLLRHLNITKFKINNAKEFETEKEVVHYCTKYLNDFPTSYSSLCNRAEAYCKSKKYNKAIIDLNDAILLKPQKSTAWYLRGAAKGLKKSYVDAIYDLSKAIIIDPKNSLALKCRAYCYYMLKSYEEALCDVKMVIILGCGSESTYINKINSMRKLKDLNNFTQGNLEVDNISALSSVNDTKGKRKRYKYSIQAHPEKQAFNALAATWEFETNVELWKEYFKSELRLKLDVK
ncbi:hypothetical protein Glove_132g206 [Diversispora epigaea]|uniref:Uncharacterized protein n=1 Tax=Diversispora epigaea TaxID=1348612 RepID=A0A397J6C0_9GLOM|nr:hypothetical protein Glove_132g206 [Diversispora epigaea]